MTPARLLHVAIAKALPGALLARALEELQAGSPALHLAWDGGAFTVLAADALPAASELLHVEPEAARDDAGWERFRRRVRDGLDPARGLTLRVGLWPGEGAADLLLAMPCDCADARALEVLAEDLFRACEQLEQERPVSLAALGLTYTAFALEQRLRHGRALCGPPPPGAGRGGAPRVISLSAQVESALWRPLPDLDVDGCELALSALLALLARWPARPAGELVVVDDLRRADPRLARTPGPLACARGVAAALWDDPRLSGDARGRGSALRDGGLGGWPTSPTPAAPGVCVDVQDLRPRPWLGGETWHPLDAQRLPPEPARAALDLRLACGPRGLRLHVAAAADELAAAAAAWLEPRLEAELDALLSAARRVSEGRRFWKREFHAHDGRTNVELPRRPAPGEAPPPVACQLPAGAWAALTAAGTRPVEDVALAGVALLLSRLSGREDVVVVWAEEGRAAFPVRLELLWTQGFAHALARVTATRARAAQHAEAAPEALAGAVPQQARPRLDAACVRLARQPGAQGAPATLASLCRDWAAGIDLWASVATGESEPSLHLHGSGRVDAEALAQAAEFLGCLLGAAAEDERRPMGDLPTSPERRAAPPAAAADELAGFRF